MQGISISAPTDLLQQPTRESQCLPSRPGSWAILEKPRRATPISTRDIGLLRNTLGDFIHLSG